MEQAVLVWGGVVCAGAVSCGVVRVVSCGACGVVWRVAGVWAHWFLNHSWWAVGALSHPWAAGGGGGEGYVGSAEWCGVVWGRAGWVPRRQKPAPPSKTRPAIKNPPRHHLKGLRARWEGLAPRSAKAPRGEGPERGSGAEALHSPPRSRPGVGATARRDQGRGGLGVGWGGGGVGRHRAP